MFHGQSVLAVIPARGGSKGVPRKNLRELGGMPLVLWALRAARESQYVDRTILSSDDDEIIEVILASGGDVPFRRPEALAGDLASSVDVLVHACREVPGYDWAVLLQPTSPFRTGVDIDACLEACVRGGADSATTVTEERHGVHLLQSMDVSRRLSPLVPGLGRVGRRQDVPVAYRLNGAVYAARVDSLIRGEGLFREDTVGVPMPETRSIDIDTPEDFALAEWLLSRSQH